MPGKQSWKFSPAARKRLLDAIRAGNHYTTACAYAGITYSTFLYWMQKGEKAKSGRHREFYDAVTLAEAEMLTRVVVLWQQSLPNNPQGCRDFLARRAPKEWGNKETIEQKISGKKDGEPIKLDMSGVSDDIVEFIARLARGEGRNAQDGDD